MRTMKSAKKKPGLWNKDYILLLLCCLSAAVTNSFFISVFPVYVIDLGGDTAAIGAMATGLVIASVVTRIVFGNLQDKFGRRTIMIIGAVLYTLNTVAYIFLKDLTALYVLRFLNGITQGIYFGAAGTFVSDLVPEDKLVEGIAYFSLMGTVTLFFVPTLGSLLYNLVGAVPIFIIISITASIGIVSGIMISPSKNKVQIKNLDKKKNISENKQSFITTILEPKVFIPSMVWLLASMGYASVTNFLTPFGKEVGITAISIWFTFESVTSMFVKAIAGKLTKLINPSKILVMACLINFVSLVLLSTAQNLIFVIISGILFGLGYDILPPILNSAVFKLVPSERKGVASATYNVFADFGNGSGGLIWGFVAGAVDYRLMFFVAATVMILALILHLTKLRPKYVNGEI